VQNDEARAVDTGFGSGSAVREDFAFENEPHFGEIKMLRFSKGRFHGLDCLRKVELGFVYLVSDRSEAQERGHTI
jgi:hypothetical protein